MSSGGWELVGKKKDRTNGKVNKLTKAERKKFIENAPKLEDFLPLSQVKTLYDNLDGNKETKKSPKAKEHKMKENEEKKKQQQQKQQQQAEKKKQEPKEKPPKNIKDALNAIDIKELNNVLATAQARYPEAPLIWLKDLAAFLNVKVPIDKEDAIFSGKPKDYPLSLVPKAISSTLEHVVEMAGQQSAQHFYEITLTSMATDMVKGIPVVGHKIFLQLLAHINPEMTAANIPKLITIRSSYENRKNVGLSLLWAWSQAGRKNLAVGLKIWHELMSPMLDMKGYANYVVQILNDLVFGHDNVRDLSLDLYLDIIAETYSNKFSNQPANLAVEISTSIDKLRSIVFKSKDISYTKLFEMLLGKVTPKSYTDYRCEIIKALADCLVTEPRCFAIWGSIYPTYLYQSSLLLQYIDANLPSLQPQLRTKHFKETLAIFQNSNEKWKKVKDENLANTCKVTSQALLKKMTSSTRRGFPWGIGSLSLLLLISAVIIYDVQKHGSFEASQIGIFVKTSGISKYVEKAWTTIQSYSSAGHQTIKNSSEYYKAAVDLCVPYVKLAGDVYLVVKNISIKIYNNALVYIEKKTPMVLDTIEHYFPGIVDQIQSRSLQALEFVKVSFALIGEKVIEHSSAAVEWLGKNVFVGKLSPENLGDYAVWTMRTTLSYASETYNWVYEKVQTLSPCHKY
ncbi:transmembrane protein 214-A [Harpegnathos saltator]|uniref:Transmembrane protein 214-A n=1 Tax=Harpegnathos saltator TaxID=610380 RepID=E2BYY3_HARSA|nr:transmembrane protein 214-A [Harpegnathos saltator]EFN79101.1 Transmembrane protein 214-A [Harpegnathos saltator]